FFLEVANGGLMLDQIGSSAGSISATTGSGVLVVVANGVLSAEEGNLALIANTGTISIGANAILSAQTEGETLGNVYLSIRPVPTAPTVGTTPENVVANITNSGNVYFGVGVTASAPTNT